MNIRLCEKARPFLCYLDEWYHQLPEQPLSAIVGQTPEQVAVFSIDMIKGFCCEGPLASPRVDALRQPVADIFQRAYDLGVRAFVLTQDAHDPDTPEFDAYPSHCVAGTSESEAVPELAELPFASEITTIHKKAISSDIGTSLESWLNEHPHCTTFVLVGDCTDLCIYSAAMFLRMHANVHRLQRRVIVPAAAVDTFDTPLSVAQKAGISAHDGDLHHVLFLHHMALNGIEIVARV